jgi:hypothetical protein
MRLADIFEQGYIRQRAYLFEQNRAFAPNTPLDIVPSDREILFDIGSCRPTDH